LKSWIILIVIGIIIIVYSILEEYESLSAPLFSIGGGVIGIIAKDLALIVVCFSTLLVYILLLIRSLARKSVIEGRKTVCSFCNGTGEWVWHSPRNEAVYHKCSHCNGTGRK
jgi:hypothetical protein